MKWSGFKLFRKFLKEESGQSLVMVALTGTTMMALAVTSMEVGHIYYAYQRLVASTNAATLAGAEEMSNALISATSSAQYQSDVQNVVVAYSSQSGKYNATGFLSGDTIKSVVYECLTTVEDPPMNVGCAAPAGSTTGYNALQVTQTATVNLWFGGLIGIPSMSMSAVSTAAMKGGTDTAYNLAIIIDNTKSMASPPTNRDPNCTQDEIVCAIQGFTVMLENMDPCALDTSCSSSTPYVDGVALFVFPLISTADSGSNYKQLYCGTSGVSTIPYNFINVTPGSQNLGMATSTTNGVGVGAYEVIPFNDVYKANDGTTALAVSSALAEAVGYSGSGCSGLSAPGGQGTYYAQVIYNAQQALATQQMSNPGSRNIMIILSDGDATACNAQVSVTVSGCSGSQQIEADNCPTITTANDTSKTVISSATPCLSPYTGQPLNGTEATVTINSKPVTIQPTGWNNPAYPSALGECGQAVYEAQAATAAGTTVYTVAFGSETSGACPTDQTYTLTGLTNGAQTWPSGTYSKEPCNAIAAMASNSSTFYSDDTGGCPAISATNSAYTSLAQIFKAIVTGLTSPRLIPNGTT